MKLRISRDLLAAAGNQASGTFRLVFCTAAVSQGLALIRRWPHFVPALVHH